MECVSLALAHTPQVGKSVAVPVNSIIEDAKRPRVVSSWAGNGKWSSVGEICHPVTCQPGELPGRQYTAVASCLQATASVGGAGIADERGSSNQDSFLGFSSSMMVPSMAGGGKQFGSFAGATLERSKLDLNQVQAQQSAKTEDGGGGGDIGKGNKHGGGDGGDDGGDDDDYAGDFDGGDEGDDSGPFRLRKVLPELFDRLSIEAVLQEWFKTIVDLPAGLRQAVEMGLVSSLQMARFLSVSARPTVTRAIARVGPEAWSRSFVGRVLADPAFVYKVFWEQALTVGTGVWWEVHHRGARLKDEWDLAAANILTASLCNLAIVWSLAPSRSYGSLFRYEWQNMLQKLPNNVFDKSYPLREFTRAIRASSFFYKAAELSLAGVTIGAVGGALSNGALALKKSRNPEYETSVAVPTVGTSALGFGAFLGVSGNIRYQLLMGVDRMAAQYLNSLGTVVAATFALRYFNIWIGEPSRLALLGLDTQPSPEVRAQAYKRPSLSPSTKSIFSLPKFGLPEFVKGGAERLQANKARRTRRTKPKRKVYSTAIE